ncbi:hypothetical protein [Tenacibaculum retecalamus]|uniref:hypothetical protein n=1 Tax=Tenacibaculum retecalamus TaxID=3018315 RepID=UPI0023D9643D|nr:hypothetical protein [Tenacibaculum retecalamus]WBX70360.1 hypothetical protein PG912_08725 [Tenacibaculum retecalamus]
MAQSDNYSDSVNELIELINKKLNSTDSLSIKIEFTNRHRREYKINSIVTLKKENVTLKSHINNMLDEDSHVVFNYAKAEFETELKNQIKILSDYKKQLILGGNHQEINLTYNNLTKTYRTQKALALMNLFDSGGLKYEKK